MTDELPRIKKYTVICYKMAPFVVEERDILDAMVSAVVHLSQFDRTKSEIMRIGEE